MGSYIGYVMTSMPQSRDILENRRSTDDKMSREMWEEIENRKTDKARMEEAGRERGKERNEETNNRGRKNHRKNNGRKGERRERFDKVESDRRNGSKTVP